MIYRYKIIKGSSGYQKLNHWGMLGWRLVHVSHESGSVNGLESDATRPVLILEKAMTEEEMMEEVEQLRKARYEEGKKFIEMMSRTEVSDD